MINKVQIFKIRHFFRDLFKPRYGLAVQLERFPDYKDPFNGKMILVPVIMCLPFKRPFFMPYNVFVNGMHKRFGFQSLVFFGSRRTLMALDGIGSVLPHNMKNAITFSLPINRGDEI